MEPTLGKVQVLVMLLWRPEAAFPWQHEMSIHGVFCVKMELNFFMCYQYVSIKFTLLQHTVVNRQSSYGHSRFTSCQFNNPIREYWSVHNLILVICDFKTKVTKYTVVHDSTKFWVKLFASTGSKHHTTYTSCGRLWEPGLFSLHTGCVYHLVNSKSHSRACRNEHTSCTSKA